MHLNAGGEKKKDYLHVFISSEGPAQLGGEGGFSDSPLPAQYEDFSFDPRKPFVDHWDRRRVLGRRFGLTRRTDVLVRTPFASVHLACQVRLGAWTVVGCIRRDVCWLLYGDHELIKGVIAVDNVQSGRVRSSSTMMNDD